MKKFIVLSAIASAFLIYACGSGGNTSPSAQEGIDHSSSVTPTTEKTAYDPERGEGKFKHVEIPVKLDATMAGSGQKTYELKCSGCHKLTDEKLVGPGWKGVTNRQKPEWIMNFITNTDAMIDKDPKVQAQLELCLVRMPNQNLSDEQARALYEFMRRNDGIK